MLPDVEGEPPHMVLFSSMRTMLDEARILLWGDGGEGGDVDSANNW